MKGLSGALYNHSPNAPPETDPSPDVFRVVLGVLLIAFAQLFTASQFVLEEFIMAKHTIQPIQMVGWEGVFGFSVTIIGMPILYAIFGLRKSGEGGYFDIPYGAHQLFSKPEIWGTAIAIMFSIGYVSRVISTKSRSFNFFGLSVTRNVSATSRSIIDTLRTLFVWLFSLSLGWEQFNWLQVLGTIKLISLLILGFAILVWGTFTSLRSG